MTCSRREPATTWLASCDLFQSGTGLNLIIMYQQPSLLQTLTNEIFFFRFQFISFFISCIKIFISFKSNFFFFINFLVFFYHLSCNCCNSAARLSCFPFFITCFNATLSSGSNSSNRHNNSSLTLITAPQLSNSPQ